MATSQASEVGVVETTLTFGVNGRIVTVPNAKYDPSTNLLSFLREELGLVGTKAGCGEGGCGMTEISLIFFSHLYFFQHNFQTNFDQTTKNTIELTTIIVALT